MFNIIKKMITIAAILGLSSCACNNKYSKPNVADVLPRKAFVHLEKSLLVRSCSKTQCISMNFRSSASGFIVNVHPDGAFIITAAHFCENSTSSTKNTKVTARYKTKTLDGTKFDSVALHYKRDIDVCLIYSEGMTGEISAVNLAKVGPRSGEKIFNIGAPQSIVGANMVPILEGRFNGDLRQNAFYTLPAAPGSSGSMIVNERGELIGMVHSVFMRFHVLSLSTKYEDLKEYIQKYLYKYRLYKTVMDDLELENIFTAKD